MFEQFLRDTLSAGSVSVSVYFFPPTFKGIIPSKLRCYPYATHTFVSVGTAEIDISIIYRVILEFHIQ